LLVVVHMTLYNNDHYYCDSEMRLLQLKGLACGSSSSYFYFYFYFFCAVVVVVVIIIVVVLVIVNIVTYLE